MYLKELNDIVKDFAEKISDAETPEEAKMICNELAPEIDFEDKVCFCHNLSTRMVVSKPEFSRAMLGAFLVVLQSNPIEKRRFVIEFSKALSEVCKLEKES